MMACVTPNREGILTCIDSLSSLPLSHVSITLRLLLQLRNSDSDTIQSYPCGRSQSKAPQVFSFPDI